MLNLLMMRRYIFTVWYNIVYENLNSSSHISCCNYLMLENNVVSPWFLSSLIYPVNCFFQVCIWNNRFFSSFAFVLLFLQHTKFTPSSLKLFVVANINLLGSTHFQWPTFYTQCLNAIKCYCSCAAILSSAIICKDFLPWVCLAVHRLKKK